MKRLLPWLSIAILLCLVAAIEFGPADTGHTALQEVCSAPSCLVQALYDHCPFLQLAQGLVQRAEELIGAQLPYIPKGVGSVIDSIIVKAAPRFL